MPNSHISICSVTHDRCVAERFQSELKPLKPPFKSLAYGLKKPPQVRLEVKKSEYQCKF